MRRATIAVAAILKPIASEYTNIMMDSVRPTVATACVPSLATKNTSTTANRLSIIISRTIGMESNTIALRIVMPV
jgi:hypothetical protein